MKTKWKVALGVVALGVLCERAQAVNPDTMVVSVTPSVTYSVSIASPMAGGYQFGTVALGATTISTAAIAVTNDGNVTEFFSLAVSNSSPDGWTVAGTAAADAFRLSGRFNTTQPADSAFLVADDMTNTAPGTAQNKFGQGVTKTSASAAKNLWLRLIMPTSLTATPGAQTMTLTVNGQAS